MFSSRTNWPLTLNRLSRAIEEVRRRGLPLLDLTESNPTRCGFAFDAHAILEALANPRALSYEPDPHGLLPARQAVVSYYAERGIALDPGQIFLTTSTSEAYSYVFRLLADSADTILAPQPSYPLFDFLAGLNDVGVVPYPLIYDQGWQIDLPTLEKRLDARARAILVVHPNNPTGSFVRRRELAELLAFCQWHEMALVADEVFADYPFAADTQRVVSHAAVTEVLTFTLSGLSKISALPQMKLAWLVVNGPPEILRSGLARLEIIADTYLSVSAPLALALPGLLETRRTLQPQILERVTSNLESLDARLASGQPVSRLVVEGGWYVILRLPTIRTDEEWAMELANKDGVLVHPGHFFDFTSEGNLVISLLTKPEVFEEGIARILKRVASSA
jgi:aspartate/methionine/tyrosine aminotransferase